MIALGNETKKAEKQMRDLIKRVKESGMTEGYYLFITTLDQYFKQLEFFYSQIERLWINGRRKIFEYICMHGTGSLQVGCEIFVCNDPCPDKTVDICNVFHVDYIVEFIVAQFL